MNLDLQTLLNPFCSQRLIEICVKKGEDKLLKIVLENLEKLENLKKETIKLAIQNGNLKILTLLKPYIDEKKYFNDILEGNDRNVLKLFYTLERDYSSEILHTILTDNVDFFKYLISLHNLYKLPSEMEKQLENIKKYSPELSEKEWNLVYFINTILSYKAFRILKYLFSFKGIYNLVKNEYKSHMTEYPAIREFVENYKN